MNASDRLAALDRIQPPPLRLLERPARAPRPVQPAADGWGARLERWAQRLFTAR